MQIHAHCLVDVLLDLLHPKALGAAASGDGDDGGEGPGLIPGQLLRDQPGQLLGEVNHRTARLRQPVDGLGRILRRLRRNGLDAQVINGVAINSDGAAFNGYAETVVQRVQLADSDLLAKALTDKATISLGDGKNFSIICKNNSSENIYVQSAKLNGKTYTKSYIMYQDMMKGGTLELQMGNQPSKWGTRGADRP